MIVFFFEGGRSNLFITRLGLWIMWRDKELFSLLWCIIDFYTASYKFMGEIEWGYVALTCQWNISSMQKGRFAF